MSRHGEARYGRYEQVADQGEVAEQTTAALYPQAARVLRRIVVRLAQARRGIDKRLAVGGEGISSDESIDPWATLDELLGTEALPDHPTDGGVGRLAFYGRCSTEDNQDPKTSKAWQLGEATRFVEPLGGVIVEEFFDIGQSRSLP